MDFVFSPSSDGNCCAGLPFSFSLHASNAPGVALSMLFVLLQKGEDFLEAAEAYVAPFLEKGIPSLFSDLKPLNR